MAGMSGTSTTKVMVDSVTATANTLAGSLTAQLRDIERVAWRHNKELVHWHQQFTSAKSLLLEHPPAKKRSMDALLADLIKIEADPAIASARKQTRQEGIAIRHRELDRRTPTWAEMMGEQ